MTTTDPGTGTDLIDLAAPSTLREYLRDMWRWRRIATTVAAQQYRASNSLTSLGSLWAVLDPVLQVFVYWLIFDLILNTTRGVPNLMSFLAVGVFAYRYMQSTIMKSTNAVTSNKGLIRSVYFPRALLPVQVLVDRTLDLATTAVVMFVFIMIVGEAPRWTWLYYPGLVVLMGLFALGAGLVTARINSAFRDFSNFLPFFLRVNLFLSGVIIPVDRRFGDSVLAEWLFISPTYSLVALVRAAMLSYEFDPLTLVSAVLWATVLPVVGLLWFRRGEATYGRN